MQQIASGFKFAEVTSMHPLNPMPVQSLEAKRRSDFLASVEECLIDGSCSGIMDTAYYRDRAKHLRELADVTWQPRLELMLRDLARDYEETAEKFEADGKAGSTSREFF